MCDAGGALGICAGLWGMWAREGWRGRGEGTGWAEGRAHVRDRSQAACGGGSLRAREGQRSARARTSELDLGDLAPSKDAGVDYPLDDLRRSTP